MWLIHFSAGAIRRAFGSAVGWSFVSTALRMGGLVLLLPFILKTVPSDRLGLWYVFLTIGSLNTLIDIGFGPTMARATGYLWAGSRSLLPRGLVDAKEGHRHGSPNYELLASLVETARWCYRMQAILIPLLIGLGGWWWIEQKIGGMPDAWNLRLAWFFYVAGLTFNTAGALWPFLLQGINEVRLSQQIFTGALLLNYIFTLAGLFLGFDIWAMVFGHLLQAFVIRHFGKHFFWKKMKLGYSGPEQKVAWELLKTLWPMAWRSGLISIGIFFTTQANTLICSAKLGLRDTASYGLSLQLVWALLGVSVVWLGVKGPLMNQLRARGEVSSLVDVFVSRLRWCIATYWTGAVILLAFGPTLVHLIGSKTELLPRGQLFLLLFFMFFEMHQSLYAILVLSENENPFVVPVLVSGLLVGASSWIITPYYGVTGMILSFGLVQMAFNHWWTVARGLRGINMRFRDFFLRVLNV